jgi:hypothetical protein
MGTIGTTLAIAGIIIGTELTLIATWILCRALWPRRVDRAAERCAKRPVLSFVVGAPIVAATIALFVFLVNKAGPVGSIAGWVILGVGYFFACTGMAGLATHIGNRLESPLDDLRPWRPTLRGGIVLGLSYLMPIVGWIGVTLISIMIGTGANTLSFFSRRKPLSPPPLDDDAISDRLNAGAAYAARRPEEALR